MIKKLPFILLIGILCCLAQGSVSAKNSDRTKWYYQDHKKIKLAVALHLNRFYESKYDFRNIGKKGSKHFFSTIDIEEKWALAVVTPRRSNPPEGYIPDGAGFLLKKQKNQWKVLGMGTSLDGFGKKFGVPEKLWDKWLIQ